MKRCWVAAVAAGVLMSGCSKRKASTIPPPPALTFPPDYHDVPAKRPARRTPREAAVVSPPAAVTTPPVLEAMTTEEERRAALQLVHLSLARAESNIAALRGREFGPEGIRDMARVQSFIQQTRSAVKANDLVTAREYALRAEILSEDLRKR
jgi:hypothetical protein